MQNLPSLKNVRCRLSDLVNITLILAILSPALFPVSAIAAVEDIAELRIEPPSQEVFLKEGTSYQFRVKAYDKDGKLLPDSDVKAARNRQLLKFESTTLTDNVVNMGENPNTKETVLIVPGIKKGGDNLQLTLNKPDGSKVVARRTFYAKPIGDGNVKLSADANKSKLFASPKTITPPVTVTPPKPKPPVNQPKTPPAKPDYTLPCILGVAAAGAIAVGVAAMSGGALGGCPEATCHTPHWGTKCCPYSHHWYGSDGKCHQYISLWNRGSLRIYECYTGR